MNLSEYTALISNPLLINEQHTLSIENIINDFPYFQSARALNLKTLYIEDSFRYNNQLKITAAYTTDRSVLFDFITSENFNTLQQETNKSETTAIKDEPQKIEKTVINSIENAILTTIKNASPAAVSSEENQIKNPIEKIEEHLEIGKPLVFSNTEKHSFQEWLQLSKIQKIDRNETLAEITPQIEEKTNETDNEKRKKIELIDKFIEANPKIPPIKIDSVNKSNVEPIKSENSFLMTETLAKIYLEQKKYQKAIQAYQILILKYPEKSSLFANKISDIKILQQNNKF
jgi:hypothetical protein